MVYEVWDVVHLPAYPNQENPNETTARPAIIIEDLQDEVELCCLTKQVQQASKYKYYFIVKKDSSEGIQMGLTFDSLVVIDRTIPLKKFRKRDFPISPFASRSILNSFKPLPLATNSNKKSS